MKYVPIQGLETPCSQLVLGSDYYNPDNLDKVGPLMDAFVAFGGNCIDTGYIYGGGRSEEALGIWMEQRGNRDKMLILTKGAHPDPQGNKRVTPHHIAEELAISLERLRTDYIDMYALHRDDPDVPVGPIMEALNEHIAAGRIRSIGASNWTHERLQEANDYAAAHGMAGFAFNSPNLSLAKANEPYWAGCVSADEAMCDWHERTQMPLLSWSSQARGFFSGRYSPDRLDDKDTVRVFYSEGNWERLARAEKLAARKQATTIQIACAYVLSQSFPACALIGPQTVQEMQASVDAVEMKLSQDELRWLDLRSNAEPW